MKILQSDVPLLGYGLILVELRLVVADWYNVDRGVLGGDTFEQVHRETMFKHTIDDPDAQCGLAIMWLFHDELVPLLPKHCRNQLMQSFIAMFHSCKCLISTIGFVAEAWSKFKH